ncbi:MAG: paraquat-inducible protein A [Hyphomicrobiaceae bacterium]|nr:paraquat-inducible protein A [Hyphomicrobiaceae bacterium]MCC0009922.1 paraquat-inducible protein A [Hyphomicrobiaceae bacterium]
MRLGGRRFLLSFAIIGASVCLALGVSLPIIRLTKYVFWSTEHSLLSTVYVLINDGQYFLGITVALFSICFPVLKLLYLLLVSTLPASELARQSRRLRALEWLGKWSMHDVLVLALTIFFIKSTGLYDAASLSGVYFFTASVVLMILAYAWLRGEQRERFKIENAQHAGGATGIETDVRRPHGPPLDTDQDEPQPKLSIVRNFVLSFFIILATVFFVLGVILPVIRFTTIYVWTNEHSIATIIYALYTDQEYFLCVVLFTFSILFPFLKLFYLMTLVASPDLSPEFRARSISTMEWLGRYSMTDVMVLALLIFYINSSGYTEASVQPGVYFFAASAIMTMLAYGWANTVPPRRLEKRARTPRPRPLAKPSPTAVEAKGGKTPKPSIQKGFNKFTPG